MLSKRKWSVVIFLTLIVFYLLGPKPKFPNYNLTFPKIDIPINKLDSFINHEESKFEIKSNNEAKIIWVDTIKKQKTEYAILYLPGFTGSQAEADPIHKEIAKKFGMNMYLARLYGHGLKDTLHTFEDFTADKYWESAKQAFAIAKQLGNKLIIMSTSTGGTLSLKLTAEYNNVFAQILLSPNIEINDSRAFLLNKPWGKQIASIVKNSNTIHSKRQDSIYKQYWNAQYNIKGAVELEELLETSMTNETFSKIKIPTCMLYFYKDDEHQDSIVKVSAMLNMYEKIATPNSLKQKYNIPNANTHVIGSYIQSNDFITVKNHIINFIETILKIQPVN